MNTKFSFISGIIIIGLDFFNESEIYNVVSIESSRKEINDKHPA